jgi:hypothetical protein
MAYSNKMIKEDHLLACTTRMLEIQARADHPEPIQPIPVDRPLGFHPNYRVHPAFGHTPSRLPTIHLSKNYNNTAANQLRFGVVISFPIAVAVGQGRRILASPPSLSTAVAKIFSALRGGQPLANYRPGQRLSSHHSSPHRRATRSPAGISLTTQTRSRFARRSVFQSVATATSDFNRSTRRS